MRPSPPTPEKPWFGRRAYDLLFRFFGPAQLGAFDPKAETRPPDSTFACPVCGHPMSQHTYQESAGRKRMTCPGPPLRAHS